MEDTRMGASRNEAAREERRPERTTRGKYAQFNRPGRRLGKVDVEIP
jgi:hypothetical protein